MSNRGTQWLQEAPFAKDLGLQVLGVADSACRLILPFAERNTEQGAVHPGTLAAVASLSAQAIVAQGAASEAEVPSVVALQVGYIRPAKTQSVWVETRPLRRSRLLGLFETRLLDHDGKLAAQAFVSIGELRGAGEGRGAARAAASAGAAGLQALLASPFGARRQLRALGAEASAAEVLLPAAEPNLGLGGTLHEGAALALLTATGVLAPQVGAASPAEASGFVHALQAQVHARLPAKDVTARATVRARDGQLAWCDVEVAGAQDRKLYATGTVALALGDLGPEPKGK